MPPTGVHVKLYKWLVYTNVQTGDACTFTSQPIGQFHKHTNSSLHTWPFLGCANVHTNFEFSQNLKFWGIFSGLVSPHQVFSVTSILMRQQTFWGDNCSKASELAKSLLPSPVSTARYRHIFQNETIKIVKRKSRRLKATPSWAPIGKPFIAPVSMVPPWVPGSTSFSQRWTPGCISSPSPCTRSLSSPGAIYRRLSLKS